MRSIIKALPLKAIWILDDVGINIFPANSSVLMCSERRSHPGFFGQKDGSYNTDLKRKEKWEQIHFLGPSNIYIYVTAHYHPY